MIDSDELFLSALERCSIPNHLFRHRDHVRAAWLYVTRDGAEEAMSAMQQAIHRFAAHHGHEQKFNLTLTILWVKLVAVHAKHHGCPTFDDFAKTNAALLDKDLVLKFYTRERLFSDSARQRWIDPDLRSLPDIS
jgi:hypothetical protein